MSKTVLRFEDVSFEYEINKPLLTEVNFSVKEGSKVALMGQNGAGKSTLLKLILKELNPTDGDVILDQKLQCSIARQVIPPQQLDLSVRDFFQACFLEKVYNIDSRIQEVLEVVRLEGIENVLERTVMSFSGGQQARLLLASALIVKSDILLLDESTNNLDAEGIEHLKDFLKKYTKTILIISHDADFLDSFTDGVLYLDSFLHTVEYFHGTYKKVEIEVSRRIQSEQRKNAQIQKKVEDKRELANKFANKGGAAVRTLAKKMKKAADSIEKELVEVKKEDVAIRNFSIPAQADASGTLITLNGFTVFKNGKEKRIGKKLIIRKGDHVLLVGPNGIGKSTLLERLSGNEHPDYSIKEGVRVGYYRQDFSNLPMDSSAYEYLCSILQDEFGKKDEEKVRAVAANFMIGSKLIHGKISGFSEGQKGLLAIAGLVLKSPGILLVDEPTNHINFRHLAALAKAFNEFQGALIMISHMKEFVQKLQFSEIFDLDIS